MVRGRSKAQPTYAHYEFLIAGSVREDHQVKHSVSGLGSDRFPWLLLLLLLSGLCAPVCVCERSRRRRGLSRSLLDRIFASVQCIA